MTSSSHKHAARSGFTLIEAVISMAVVSLVGVSSLNVIGSVSIQQRGLLDQARGAAIAQQLLSEIQRLRYEDTVTPTFGPEIGEVRDTYDDVDDFNGFSATPRAGLDMLSTTWDGWNLSAQVVYVSPSDLSTPIASDQGLKRITVTVVSPSKRIVSLVALRSRAGLYNRTPESTKVYNARITVSIETGGNTYTTVQQSADLMNMVP